MQFTAKSALDFLGYPAEVASGILALYNEPHRKYHNEGHLDHILRWVNPEYKDVRALLESIVFHDVYYGKTLASVGFYEAMSVAMYAAQTKVVDARVVGAINATAHHDKDQSHLTDLAKVVLDFDLQSFAQSRSEFLTDSHNVKLEYLPMVGEKAFIKGNKKFIQTLLRRKRIYYTLTSWEDRARDNLAWRLKNMEEVSYPT